MSREQALLDRLRAIAGHPAARGLADDAAVLPIGGKAIVLTHDMLVEGVHYRTHDAPADIAWKLLAVNLSDLAAKGARPLGVLLGYALGPDESWDEAFVCGLEAALAAFDVPLLGGDTVAMTGPRALGLTALGLAPSGGAPTRSGARAGEALWVTGRIGRAGLGLAGDPAHVDVYLRPMPRLAEGRALAPLVGAMMDVSDGLLLDAARMAAASSVAFEIELDAVPVVGDAMAAVTAGDDYELLFTLAADVAPPVAATQIGAAKAGAGLSLRQGGRPLPLPARLGWTH